jgi:hypothetical protein
MKNLIVFIATLILQPAFLNNLPQVYGQSGNETQARLEEFTRQTAPRKLHMHFDKQRYNAGEGMWFNVYLLDGVTHLPDTARTNVYVDLITSGGVLMERCILLAENGVAGGDIALPLTLPDGNYVIRAYTSWMKNFPEDYFFTRYFYISNKRYEEIIPRPEARSNRRFNKNLERLAGDYDITFYPEGGEMISNVVNRVAFKMVDALGRGVDAEGVVIDGSGRELIHFNTIHAGMGSFEIIPESGSVYRARVLKDGRPVVFNLPPARNEGVALRIDREENSLQIGISSGLSPGDKGYMDEVFLLAHTRGMVLHSESLPMLSGKAKVKIPEAAFPAGITHITVFSPDSAPLAERLVFIDRKESLIISPRVTRMQLEDGEYYGLLIEVSDAKGNPVQGQFSMSILAGEFDSPGTSENILSNILLSSDLNGIIENPQYYLDPEKEMDNETDLLMMVHGWRRFQWESVIKGEIPELIHERSSGIRISGRLVDPVKGDPVNNQLIRLNILSGYNDVFIASTNNRGIFMFDGLGYRDMFRIELSASRLEGNYSPRIELMTGDISGLTYTPNIYTRNAQITSRGRNWKRVREAGKSPYAIVADRTPVRQQYGTPDQSIYVDQDNTRHRSVYDLLLERAVGLQANGNQLMFRGPTSLTLSNEPMFMLDGIQTEKEVVLRMNPREIQRIEIYKGASTSAFGVRGGGGVIIAYTGLEENTGSQESMEYLLTGYHTPREFYSDYLAGIFGPSNIPSAETIFWQSQLITGEDGNHVLLPVKDVTGKLKIVIEGIGNNGSLGFGEFTLEPR